LHFRQAVIRAGWGGHALRGLLTFVREFKTISNRSMTAHSNSVSQIRRLATWDFSVLKDTKIRERLSLQFRSEIFDLLNRANFNTPNLIAFTPPTAANPTGSSGTASAITSTSTTSRQVQFGLKLLW
jgi:hypothetical protein